MKQKITLFIVTFVFMLTGVVGLALVPSQVASASNHGSNACSGGFLGFPAWYDGLTDSECNIKSPGPSGDNGSSLSQFIWRIVLNVIGIVLRLIAYAAAGFIIYGGFKYLTSAGFPDRITSARKIIQNAVIGLVLSFLSIAIVSLVAGNLS